MTWMIRLVLVLTGLVSVAAPVQAQGTELQAAGTSPAAPPQAAVPPAASPPPAAQEVIYHGEATSILGRQVAGPDKAVVGRIVDVLVDEAGQPRAVVIDLGGFMGIGNRRIAVAWRALRFAPGAAARDTVTLELTADQVRETPEYKPASRPVTVAAPPARTEPQPETRPEAAPSGQP